MTLAFIRVLPIRVDTFFPKRSLGKDVGTKPLESGHYTAKTARYERNDHENDHRQSLDFTRVA